MAPSLCVNGCGFYGSAANKNFCSKCYKDYLQEHCEQKSESEGAEIEDKKLKEPCAIKSTPIDDLRDVCAGLAAIKIKVTETEMEAESTATRKTNRCKSCNKKVGLTGFECQCGNLFCGRHRYPEEHSCNVDYKKIGRQALKKQNPQILADKLEFRV